MKIIIAIDNFRIGGAERVASLIANELSAQHEVHAIIFEKEIRYSIDPNVKLHIISPSKIGRFRRVILRLIDYNKIIREIQPDIIFSFAYVGIYAAFGKLLAHNKQAKLICSERTDPAREPESKIARYLRDWAYSKCDTLVCQTPFVVDYFKGNGLKVKYKVIPNPVKEHLPFWAGNESKTFVTACRLAKQKNLPLMLNAFKRFVSKYPGYSLKIYGEGPEESSLINLRNQLGLDESVHFEPFSTNIHDIMKNALAYVSSSDYEGISNSMLEALAIGMPTICTDCPVGGANMFIKNGINGFLVPVGDENSLFHCFEKVISCHTDLDKISQQAQQIRTEISPSKIVTQWLSLIE